MKSVLNFVAANVNSLILKVSEPTHVEMLRVKN